MKTITNIFNVAVGLSAFAYALYDAVQEQQEGIDYE